MCVCFLEKVKIVSKDLGASKKAIILCHDILFLVFILQFVKFGISFLKIIFPSPKFSWFFYLFCFCFCFVLFFSSQSFLGLTENSLAHPVSIIYIYIYGGEREYVRFEMKPDSRRRKIIWNIRLTCFAKGLVSSEYKKTNSYHVKERNMILVNKCINLI